MEKKTTHKKTSAHILEFVQGLLSTGRAGTHEEIAAAIQSEGFSVSQSKVSRLLHKLGAFKVVTASGKQTYRLPHEYGLAHELSKIPGKNALKSFILQVSANEMLIVVRTVPGSASFVARSLDEDPIGLHILGTLAGDDTIFVVPTTVSDITMTLDRVKEKLFG